MLGSNLQEFRRRLAKVERKRRPRLRPRIPWLAVIYALTMVFTLKVVIFVHFGEQAYERKLSALNSDSLLAKLGIIAMMPDPVTQGVGQTVDKIR